MNSFDFVSISDKSEAVLSTLSILILCGDLVCLGEP
jgi:hypothetical protein